MRQSKGTVTVRQFLTLHLEAKPQGERAGCLHGLAEPTTRLEVEETFRRSARDVHTFAFVPHGPQQLKIRSNQISMCWPVLLFSFSVLCSLFALRASELAPAASRPTFGRCRSRPVRSRNHSTTVGGFSIICQIAPVCKYLFPKLNFRASTLKENRTELAFVRAVETAKARCVRSGKVSGL